MTIAFVLSGGTSLGAVQVGMAHALDDAGIVPDMIVATSVGAVNGACLVSGHSVEHLAEIWCSLRRRDLFPCGRCPACSDLSANAPTSFPMRACATS